MPNFENLNSAYQSLEIRRQSSATSLLKMQEKVFSKVPRIEEIGFEITSLGASYTMAKLAKDLAKAKSLRAKMDLLDLERTRLLIENGFTEDALIEKHFCNLCNDKGVVNGKMCSCMHNQMARNRQKKLTALSPAPNASFEDFCLEYYPKTANAQGIVPYNHMEKVVDYCKAFSKHFSTKNKSVLMVGAAGLGKTHLACSIAKECIAKGYIVMYSSSQSLFSQIEHSKYNDEDIIESITTCDLFILDDLGTEYLTNYSLSALYNIINTRMVKGLPCIYTTNLTSQQALTTRYGEKIVSRLQGTCQTLSFIGEDIRIKKSTK